jgi:hypothetical protein
MIIAGVRRRGGGWGRVVIHVFSPVIPVLTAHKKLSKRKK